MCLAPHRNVDTQLIIYLPVFNIAVCDTVFSDHMPVLFDVTLSCNTVIPRAAAQLCLFINQSAAAHFSAIFNQNSVIPETMSDAEDLSGFTPLANLF